MKFIARLFVILFSSATICYGSVQRNLSSIEIVGDTINSNGKAYCLLIERDGMHIIRTLSKESIVYIQSIEHNNQEWFRLSFAPLNRVYYTPAQPQFATTFLHSFIKYQLIEDGYFSAYGANTLIEDGRKAGRLFEEWELPVEKKSTLKSKDWNISWKSTENKDSVTIIKNGVPFGYYIYRPWYSYGVDSWEIAYKTKSNYRYFIYKLDKTPLAEVRVADGWKTEVKILTTDGETYEVKNVPGNKDFMTIAVKLLLAKEELK